MLQQQVGLQNQVPQQPLGQQQQGLNKDGQARPGRTVLKRQDGAEEEDHLSEISDEGDDILGKNEVSFDYFSKKYIIKCNKGTRTISIEKLIYRTHLNQSF